MNAKQAKEIQLIDLLARLGVEPDYIYTKNWWYKSPIRNERRASLRVNLELNTWCDQGNKTGGTIIDFVMELEDCGVGKALSYIEEMMNKRPTYNVSSIKAAKKASEGIRVSKVKDLGHNKSLTDYLCGRGIDQDLAKNYLKEVYYYAGEKHFFALGWKNEKGGWELRNKYSKLATSKSYTFISGGRTDTCNVFEGMLDYLSALVYFQKEKSDCDTIILNSLAMVNTVMPLLEEYQKVSLFLDNDSAGNASTKELILAENIDAVDRRRIYKGYKDFNEFLIQTNSQWIEGKK